MRHRPTLDGRQTVSAGFTRLLARLDPDPDQAAAEYERLRVTLEKFFDWHGAWPPEECADEALDRLALKLATEAQIGDVRAYARGIARLVLLEWRRRPAPVSIGERPGHADMSAPPLIVDDEAQALPACFERCLAALSAGSRTLVLEYYVAERRAKIENRRRLAETLEFPTLRCAIACSAFETASSGASTHVRSGWSKSGSRPPCASLPG